MKRSWAGELGAERVGERVLVQGWVPRRRDHGGIVPDNVLVHFGEHAIDILGFPGGDQTKQDGQV